MTYETIKIPLETEKQNLTKIDIKPVGQQIDKLTEIYGKVFATSMKPDQKIILDHQTHPVYEGFLDAYRNHRPITISPDIIWNLILQGFCRHVEQNSEELRSKFVNFEGKKEIIIKNLEINAYEATSEDWVSILPDIINQITKFTGQKVIDIITPDFTTTTPVSLAVDQISIMSALKNYFQYKVMFGGCALPFVIVEGSLEDWNKILIKMEGLKEYKLDEWIDKLTPIIKEIIETKKGNVNKDFWLKMIKIKDNNGEYNTGYVDGWFTNFFHYNSSNYPIDPPFSEITRLANEVLQVPFELQIVSKITKKVVEKIKCEFIAGFVGITQDENNSSMKPEIGWVIRKQPDGPVGCFRDLPNELQDKYETTKFGFTILKKHV